jgi:molybdopterin-guanine dinucleotide biosynthesis protein A
MDHIEAFILAGGASTRMGTDKSQLLIGNRTFTQQIAHNLSRVTDSVTIVGQTRNHPDQNVATDVYPQWGALGGLHGALNACESPWAIVVACDLPFVTPELFARLMVERESYDAVVPIQPDGRPQPLCALYRTDPCLETATQLIEEGKRRPLDLLDAVNTHWISYSQLADLDQSEKFFLNINTPEDYYEATRKRVTDDGPTTTTHRRGQTN